MKDYQTRVFAEKKELDNKIISLNTFLFSDLSMDLLDRDRKLMVRQMHIMMEYSSILSERIDNFI